MFGKLKEHIRDEIGVTGARMSLSAVSVVCVVRGLCDGLITHPEESYRVYCVCDRGTSILRRHSTSCTTKKMCVCIYVRKFVWIIFLPMKCRWAFTDRYVFDTDDNFIYEM